MYWTPEIDVSPRLSTPVPRDHSLAVTYNRENDQLRPINVAWQGDGTEVLSVPQRFPPSDGTTSGQQAYVATIREPLAAALTREQTSHYEALQREVDHLKVENGAIKRWSCIGGTLLAVVSVTSIVLALLAFIKGP